MDENGYFIKRGAVRILNMETFDKRILKILHDAIGEGFTKSDADSTFWALHASVKDLLARGVDPRILLSHVELLSWEPFLDQDILTETLAEVVSLMTPHHYPNTADKLVSNDYWNERARLGLQGYS